jgi:hypothetical protein
MDSENGSVPEASATPSGRSTTRLVRSPPSRANLETENYPNLDPVPARAVVQGQTLPRGEANLAAAGADGWIATPDRYEKPC